MASSSYLLRAKIYPLDRVVGQARNQEFFRAGEVSESKGTSINI